MVLPKTSIEHNTRPKTKPTGITTNNTDPGLDQELVCIALQILISSIESTSLLRCLVAKQSNRTFTTITVLFI